MNKKLLEIINSLKGSLLGIGLNDDILLDAIEKNDDIYTCYLLTNISRSGKKFSMTKRGKNKKINIKKIKKVVDKHLNTWYYKWADANGGQQKTTAKCGKNLDNWTVK